MITALQGTPIVISLTDLARSSGWSVDGSIATHDSCIPGNLYIINYPITPGLTYRYTYQILTVGSGYVETFVGTNHGAQFTTPQFVDETIVAGTGELYIFANSICSIENFSIETVQVLTSQTQQNTIAFSEKVKKWCSFYSYIPDNAFTLFIDTFSFYNGNIYVHQHGSNARGNFYGVQYGAEINFSTNEQPSVVKTYLGINYQANQLLLSPSIFTQLGQQSQLFSGNYLQATYNDGTQIHSIEGMYKSSFLRDMNVDLYNGSPLKGNWLTLNLVTTSPSTPLILFTTEILYAHSYNNIR